MTTTITGKNQITLPAEIAARYKLKNGMRISWSPGRKPDEIVCRILPDLAAVAEKLQGAGRKYLRKGTDPLAELSRERAKEDRERRGRNA
jgi:bifunctional DNA-binding transcriptional regulator/antitoxin component of YhaV-PrlF toxin-antitoxin module